MTLPYFTARSETVALDDALRAQVRGDFIRCSDGLTQYELTGPAEGQLVLLVPGLTIPLDYWDPVVTELHERGYRTLTYSGYGRGYSDRVTASYDESLFVRQIQDLVHGLGVAPRHVIGSSMGAVIAMLYVLQARSTVSSLVIVGPAGLLARKPPIAALLRIPVMNRLLGSALGHTLLEGHLSHNLRDPAQVERLAALVRPCYQVEGSIYALCATLADLALANRQDLYRAVGNSGLPTMLLWGDEDQVTPAARWDEAMELLTPARAELIRQTGHMVSFERPGLTAQLFTDFATTHQGAQP